MCKNIVTLSNLFVGEKHVLDIFGATNSAAVTCVSYILYMIPIYVYFFYNTTVLSDTKSKMQLIKCEIRTMCLWLHFYNVIKGTLLLPISQKWRATRMMPLKNGCKLANGDKSNLE